MIGLNRKITHSLRSGPHLPLVLTKSSSFSPIGPRLGLFFRPRSRSTYPYSRPTGTVRVKTFTHKALSNLGEAHSTQAGCRQLRVTYIRKGDESPEGWGLHVWGDGATGHTDWHNPLPPDRIDEDGGNWYWDLPVKAQGDAFVGLLVHKGEQKAARAEIKVPEGVSEVWLVGNEQAGFLSPPDLTQVPVGSMTKQAAIWIDSGIIAWRHAITDGPSGRARTFFLHYSKDARMTITGSGVEGADETFELQPAATVLPPALAKKHPYLQFCSALRLPEDAVKQASRLLTGQLMVSLHGGPDSGSAALDATGVQLQGALDSLFMYDGPLGYRKPDGGNGSVTLWAPTAQQVDLLRWSGPQGGQAEVVPMTPGPQGTWSLPVPPGWEGSYYKYRVKVYCPWTLCIESSEATDPYSVSLAADGERSQVSKWPVRTPTGSSQFIDINSSYLAPPGWTEDTAPRLKQWTDISIYELHIRDFSVTDESVPERLRGKYLAFSPPHIAASYSAGSSGSPASSPADLSSTPTAGLKHLAKLRDAGLNHLHLLPTYDFGSVPEHEEDQATVKEDISVHRPDSQNQQAAVQAVADRDGFNWGYDPVHFSVPDGSYATDPNGIQRIVEFRSMVMALHRAGWRVVLDVVYNHTFRAGPHDRYSVLDKIVPGYYHRRMEDGEVCQSTCCNNTATENAMCERLVVDDIVHWARQYKIDGFRFDIMGHLLVSTLAKMRSRLDELTLEKDGVDGRSIYIYGEAWDFGEMVDNARGVNCGQLNLGGTGLGAFNDRIRDAALGGGPFAPHHHQGVVTGLFLAPNSSEPQQGGPKPEQQLDELLTLTDWIRYSLAGNLKRFPLQCNDGVVREGGVARAHGLMLAYGELPHENVSFVGCHDNLTSFDAITEKAALTVTAAERARMAVLCLSLVALSQGVPFFHAGDDLLRSKSLDRDSYNSGDHFNRVDWTGQDNNFGVGLPPASKNGGGWHYKQPLLANPLVKPTSEQICTATEIFQVMLRIRYSSPLFRLSDPEDVIRQLSFSNTGPNQVPGVIVMQIASADRVAATVAGGGGGGVVDPTYGRVVVVFNCSPLGQRVMAPQSPGGAAGGSGPLQLHPLLSTFAHDERIRAGCSVDAEGALVVASRTTAVFVEPR